jgi:hypothetical protein
MTEFVDDLVIDKRHQPVALVDQGYPNTERSKDAGIFAADDAGADNRQGSRQPVELQYVVAGEDPFAVERDMRVASGFRSGCNHNLPDFNRARGGGIDIIKAHGIGRHKRSCRRDDLDIVAHQLVTADVDFVLDHSICAKQQVLHRNVLLHSVRGAVEFPRAVAAKFEGRLAQRLGRDRSEIDAAPAEHRPSFDDCDFLVELSALDRGALSGRTGADHQKIVVKPVRGHAFRPLLRTVTTVEECHNAATAP